MTESRREFVKATGGALLILLSLAEFFFETHAPSRRFLTTPGRYSMLLNIRRSSGDFLRGASPKLTALAATVFLSTHRIDLDPRVLQHLVQRQSLRAFLVQHSGDQIRTVMADVCGQRPYSSISNILQRACHIIGILRILKGIHPSNHQVEHHPHGPHIHSPCIVELLAAIRTHIRMVVTLPLVLTCAIPKHLWC